MKVHAYRDGDGTTLVVGQQGIDIEVPRGGTVELAVGEHPKRYRALVRNGQGVPVVEYNLDERDVPRPVSTSHQL